MSRVLPFAAAVVFALISGFVWGPLVDAKTSAAIGAFLVALALGSLIGAVALRVGMSAFGAAGAVVASIIAANVAVFIWAVSQSH